MSHRAMMNDFVSLRRDLHRRPKPTWCEFCTTARLTNELEARDLDILYVGLKILDVDERMVVPDDAEPDTWVERAREASVRKDVLDRLAGGYTGVIAAVERGEGPTVSLRVGTDTLPIPESEVDDHPPTVEGFRSEDEGFMRTCGHDAHATVNLSVLDTVIDSDLEEMFKLFFQPGGERVADGRTVAEGGHLDDAGYLFAPHASLDHPTDEVVYGIDDFLTISHFRTELTGVSAHASAKPEEGKNANLRAATTTQNLHGIPRHSGDAARINVGLMGGGTVTNIIAEEAFIEGEVRGAMMELMEYMEDHVHTVVESSAVTHDHEVEVNVEGKAPSACSDDALVATVGSVSEGIEGVTSILDRNDPGGSEDAIYFMQHIQDHGGLVAYTDVGTDHPGGHRTRMFDAGEETVRVAADVLAKSADRIMIERP